MDRSGTTTTTMADTEADPRTGETSTQFQNAISQWRTVDFTTLMSNMDKTAAEIVAHQRDSTVQRKDLAQKTKDWRKLDDAGKLTEIKGLLKAYQTFIDLLANHAKSINSSFLQAYTALSDAPDPYPLLEASVDSMLVSEDTVPKLSEENDHLQKTVARLTAQLEEAESKRQAERATRQQLEETLESRVKEVEASWLAVLDEKKDNWAAKEKALEERVESQERLLHELKASYEVSQRLGRRSGDDEAPPTNRFVAGAELDMVNADLERTSARLAEVEARNEQLRLELAQAASQATASSTAASGSLEDDPAYMRERAEKASLLRKLDAARVERAARERDRDTKLRALEREAGLLRDERDTLRAKVQRWGDYEDVKQELEVLKSIEFSTGDDEDDDDGGSDAKTKGDTLEKLLLARNKKLGDELTMLRVSHQDLQARLQTLQQDLSSTKTALETAQDLNRKLEDELSTVQAEGSHAFPSGASVAGTYHFAAPSAAAASRNKGRPPSPTSSIIGGLHGRESEQTPVGGGILPMMAAQRDRFKRRNAELENELSEAHRTVSQLRHEVAALQKDNLDLYEKTRYVSSYNRGPPQTTTSGAASSSAYGSNPDRNTMSVGAGPAPIALDRYRRAYESNLSPFAAFRGRESARAYQRMGLPERIVYSAARMVLATRASRNLFAAYCLALHLLVFFSLYWMASIDAGIHAAGPVANGVAAAAGAAVAGRSGPAAGPRAEALEH